MVFLSSLNGCEGDYGLAEALTDISNGISKQRFFPKHRNQDAGMQIYSLNETSISTYNDNNRKMNIAGFSGRIKRAEIKKVYTG